MNEDFIAAICREPERDDVRLVFADWLEEHGDGERAEFIRVQIEIATWNKPCTSFMYSCDDGGHCNNCDGTGVRGYCKTCRGTWNMRHPWECCYKPIQDRPCEFCKGTRHDPDCTICHGTGRIASIGPRVVRCQPITRVALTDVEIFQSGGNSTYYVGGLGRFPQEYWKSLDGLPSRPAAIAAASAAAIRWARAEADRLEGVKV